MLSEKSKYVLFFPIGYRGGMCGRDSVVGQRKAQSPDSPVSVPGEAANADPAAAGAEIRQARSLGGLPRLSAQDCVLPDGNRLQPRANPGRHAGLGSVYLQNQNSEPCCFMVGTNPIVNSTKG